LGVGFAPHACIDYPAMAHGNGDTVFIDPGHGGADRGAQGVSYPGPGVDEATANLAVARDLLPLLRRAGYRVVLSRTADTSVAAESSVRRSSDGIHLDNEARVACANAAHANVLVSIHMNGFGDRSVGGAETIYDAVRPFATANEQLARLLQSDILASVRAAGWSIPDRGVLTDESQGNATPGAPAGWHHVFLLGPAFQGWNEHPSQMPGALVEPLFVTNPLEDRIVASQAGDQAIAHGIAEAVESFVAGAAPR
jgi:N-acetylmuramoyl-L-alanine amidase